MSAPALSPGDVVLVAYPFTDLSGFKVRPALVAALARPPDVVLALTTSNLEGASRADVTLDPADHEFAQSGLHGPSRIRLDRLATLEPALISSRIGSVGADTMERVRDALRNVFGL